jgi:hypothetical protein
VKGDIISLWKGYLTHHYAAVRIPVTAQGIAGEWRLETVEDHQGKVKQLLLVIFSCYGVNSPRPLPPSAVEEWLNALPFIYLQRTFTDAAPQLPPAVLQLISFFPSRLFWKIYYHSPTHKRSVYIEFDLLEAIEKNIYPPPDPQADLQL